MQPYTPTESLPIAQVNEGMAVFDSAGQEAGTVSAVQLPGTGVRPDTAVGIAEHLMAAGYLLVDASAYLANEVYVAGDEISAVDGEPAVVRLSVQRDDLLRADD